MNQHTSHTYLFLLATFCGGLLLVGQDQLGSVRASPFFFPVETVRGLM